MIVDAVFSAIGKLYKDQVSCTMKQHCNYVVLKESWFLSLPAHSEALTAPAGHLQVCEVKKFNLMILENSPKNLTLSSFWRLWVLRTSLSRAHAKSNQQPTARHWSIKLFRSSKMPFLYQVLRFYSGIFRQGISFVNLWRGCLLSPKQNVSGDAFLNFTLALARSPQAKLFRNAYRLGKEQQKEVRP